MPPPLPPLPPLPLPFLADRIFPVGQVEIKEEKTFYNRCRRYLKRRRSLFFYLDILLRFDVFFLSKSNNNHSAVSPLLYCCKSCNLPPKTSTGLLSPANPPSPHSVLLCCRNLISPSPSHSLLPPLVVWTSFLLHFGQTCEHRGTKFYTVFSRLKATQAPIKCFQKKK